MRLQYSHTSQFFPLFVIRKEKRTMVFPFRKKLIVLSILLKLILLARINQVLCHNCDCKPDLCCNRYGSCGSGNEYCGRGCQGGSCFNSHVSVTDIVSDAFFNGFVYQLGGSCNKGFYTRESFFEAIKSYPKFGMVGTKNNSRREIAAFFAHFTHDAIDRCNRVKPNSELDMCDSKNTGFPCNPVEKPPVWSSTRTQNIAIDELKREVNAISFKTALSYWMKKCHVAITTGQGFGATIRVINGPLECNGANSSSVAARVQYYTYYCNQLRVDPGTNLSC